MNRKILVLALVPLVVGLSGALAFSMFQGNIMNSINTQAGAVSVDQESYCDFSNIGVNHGIGLAWTTTGGTAIDGTLLNGNVVVQPTYTQCSSLRVGPDVVFLSSSTSSVTYTLTVSNFAPGDWVGFAFFNHNRGGSPTALPATLTFSAPTTTMTSVSQSSFPGGCGGGGCTTSPVNTGTAGFVYHWGAPTSPYVICPPSGGVGVCTPTNAGSPYGIEYYLFIGLDASTPNSGMGSSASFSFTTTATAP